MVGEKVVGFFHWLVVGSCNTAVRKENIMTANIGDYEYAVICDDDVYINISSLVLFLSNHHRGGGGTLYAGEASECSPLIPYAISLIYILVYHITYNILS